ncbi:zinc finger, CCHC-type containing protein [Tanacetum coccineum]
MAEYAPSKKFLVSNFTNYKMTDSRPVMEQYDELLGIVGRFTQHKMNMDVAIQVSCIIDKLPPSWKDFKNTLKHLKEELTIVELGSHLCIEESLKMYNDNKGKRKHHNNTKSDPNKKSKVTCWKCGKPRHMKKDCKGEKVGNKANGLGTNGATVHVCKDRCWFKTYESLNDGSILHIGNKSAALVHGRSCVDLKFSSGKIVLSFNVLHVPNIRKNLVSSSVLNNCGYKQVIESNKFVLSKHGHVHFKRMQDISKDGLIPAFNMDTEKCKTCMLNKITKKPFQNIKHETKVLELIYSDLCDLHATSSLGNKKYFMIFIDDASRFCYVYFLHSKDEALDKFKVFKIEVKLQQGSQIKRFRTDRGGEYMDSLYFQSIGIIYEMTAPYTPQQNVIFERKNRVLKEMVNFMLSYSGLSQRAVVRLPDPKLKTLGERGIECIFVGYAEHSKAFKFYDIEPNESVSINSIIESRDAIFDENRFSSVSRPSLSIPKGTKDIGGSVILEENDPKTFDEAMKSQDVSFWKEAINDEMDSIMGNNTWVLVDLPPGCKPLGCKWIFKRKLKVDETIKKFKARLVIQGFKQKSGIDYFDTYAPVARISTIRLLIAISSIHNLIIHQMDVKTAFLNGDLDEEVLYEGHGEADIILVSTPMDTSEMLMPNNGQAVSQLDYSRVIGCLMYAMTCTRPDIAFAMGKLSRLTYTGYPSVLDGYTDASWISNTEDNSSTSRWVFLLALAAAGKEAKWLKNLLLEILLWSKPIAPISIRYDNAATLAKAYSQMYNEKARHLGVRHSMIRELITNGVISIEFVRSQQNLVDHLTKGLARDLLIKSAERMGLKSNQVAEC